MTYWRISDAIVAVALLVWSAPISFAVLELVAWLLIGRTILIDWTAARVAFAIAWTFLLPALVAAWTVTR